MRRAILSILFFFCIIFCAWGQSSNFDSLYTACHQQYMGSNVEAAATMGDSVIEAAETDEQKIKSYILNSNIQQSLGNVQRAIKYATVGDRLAQLTGYNRWRAVFCKILATNFRELGLYEQSRSYLATAESMCNLLDDLDLKSDIQIELYQEQALYKMNTRSYRVALDMLDSAKRLIALDPETDDALRIKKAANYHLQGICELELGNMKTSYELMHSSLSYLTEEDRNIIPFVYRGLAEYHLKGANIDSCKHYLDLTSAYLKKAGRLRLKELYTATSAKYYMLSGDDRMANEYLKKQQVLDSDKYLIGQEISSRIIMELRKEELENRKYKLLFWWCISVASVVVILLLSYQIRYRRSKEAINLRPLQHREELNEEYSPKPAQHSRSIPETHATETELNIALETETRLIRELSALEQENFFIERDLTLNKLAGRLSSNQKYVSHIIKKYRNLDFNDYLQHKKVNYLLEKINADHSLLDYKLAYLAELSGFSSHSKFTTAFKSVMGKTPSQYIEEIRSEISI